MIYLVTDNTCKDVLTQRHGLNLPMTHEVWGSAVQCNHYKSAETQDWDVVHRSWPRASVVHGVEGCNCGFSGVQGSVRSTG